MFIKQSLIYMKNSVLLFLVLIICCSFTQAQEVKHSEKENQRLKELAKKNEGTYQVQIINSTEKYALNATFIDQVEAKRHLTDTVYFWMKKNVRVMVLPTSVISKSDFKPIRSQRNIRL